MITQVPKMDDGLPDFGTATGSPVTGNFNELDEDNSLKASEILDELNEIDNILSAARLSEGTAKFAPIVGAITQIAEGKAVRVDPVIASFIIDFQKYIQKEYSAYDNITAYDEVVVMRRRLTKITKKFPALNNIMKCLIDYRPRKPGNETEINP